MWTPRHIRSSRGGGEGLSAEAEDGRNQGPPWSLHGDIGPQRGPSHYGDRAPADGDPLGTPQPLLSEKQTHESSPRGRSQAGDTGEGRVTCAEKQALRGVPRPHARAGRAAPLTPPTRWAVSAAGH